MSMRRRGESSTYTRPRPESHRDGVWILDLTTYLWHRGFVKVLGAATVGSESDKRAILPKSRRKSEGGEREEGH